jgi:hypothetical protein
MVPLRVGCRGTKQLPEGSLRHVAAHLSMIVMAIINYEANDSLAGVAQNAALHGGGAMPILNTRNYSGMQYKAPR